MRFGVGFGRNECGTEIQIVSVIICRCFGEHKHIGNNGTVSTVLYRGLYNGKYPPPPGGGISADVIWGKKYEKTKRKRRKIWKKREERGKKIRKEEAKGKNKCKIGKN